MGARKQQNATPGTTARNEYTVWRNRTRDLVDEMRQNNRELTAHMLFLTDMQRLTFAALEKLTRQTHERRDLGSQLRQLFSECGHVAYEHDEPVLLRAYDRALTITDASPVRALEVFSIWLSQLPPGSTAGDLLSLVLSK